MTVMAQTLPRRGGVLDGVQLYRVDNLDTLDHFRRWMGSQHDGELCFDTESAGLNPHTMAHRLTQVGDKRAGWAFPPAWFGAVAELLARWRGRLGAYNTPYDYRVLGHQSGLWLPWNQLDDAQLVCQLADSAAILKLKPRASRDIDASAAAGDKMLHETMRARGWDWATVPDTLPEYWMYGAMDPVLTSWLLDKHLPGVRDRFALAYDIELGYARLCANMMSAGLLTDQPYIREWIERITGWNEQAMAWLSGNWGITSVDSNDQVGRALEAAGVPITKRTATGMACVDKAQLEHYQASHPHAIPLLAAVRDAKKAQGIVGKYLAKFLAMAGPDGVIHPSIHSVGAQRTSRSSVTNPPMHQFDRVVKAVRGSFIPRPGYCFICIDADQIEARMAAHFSADPQMIADFRHCDESGESFFINNAKRIYREDITKSDPRYGTTKNTFYAMTYGSGLTTAAITAGVSVEQLRPIYEGFKAMYPVLASRSKRLVRRWEQMHRPYVRTLTGRHLRLDRGSEYAGIDYEIQGSAAEIMKRGGIEMDAAGLGPMQRLSVHDEWILESPVGEAEEVLRMATKILTDTEHFRVPLTWTGTILSPDDDGGRLRKT